MPRQRHDPTKNLVGFLVGDVSYAVRIESVREIVNPLPIVELPRAPIAVRGVASFRGEVVPVVDLRVRFGLDYEDETRKSKWIVVDVSPPPLDGKPVPGAGRYVALVVDAVTEVFGTGGEPIRPAPPLGAGDEVRGIDGVARQGEDLVFVLSVRAFGAIADAVSGSLPPVARAT